ncbi:MAG: hypothetical protein A3C84_01265 [Candidatus Ryanbacteria bacterium RIFCSPHIGHO2_02_FULL_48_12]|jgi:ribosomal protein L35|uniref:50S ribosomal protein L35 n=1 Tax=Candidatus Ryanbacteria bacterium RIFCSPHIGHO2_01_FULL_48_27 TaxID=1802115 RepID=A0A1G2G431_9BACT|nr:MAG: hypothetical protein A2756_03770 [Candidatus Ryanbacteria bacterium RIFCSPHIGHO2_01_FULL_48_27]OGZ50740.1 MAG: hypothetical protein A3C84_01265 [Candidatus Ryanbacteria bacterium RIFCSPHIGHO2_02_FULL_48_12]
MAKTNKSVSKRIKVTKNGKALRRSSGQNHFNAKARRTKQLGKKGMTGFVQEKETLRRYPVSIHA